MKLHYYKPSPASSNFGDELNIPIWKHFLPGFFDFDESEIFLGIGTVIRVIKKKYNNAHCNIVFGSGCHKSNFTLPKNVDVKFVRGPLSAKSLGLEENKYITDPGILTPLVFPLKKTKKIHNFSYMPHYSVDSINNRKIIESLGINYISPKDDINFILKEINCTGVLLSEAMHGAIVADAYRVPWIPIYSYNSFKWKDWSLSMNLKIKFYKIKRVYNTDSRIKLFVKKIIIDYQLSKIKKKKANLSNIEIHEIKTNEILAQINKLIKGVE